MLFQNKQTKQIRGIDFEFRVEFEIEMDFQFYSLFFSRCCCLISSIENTFRELICWYKFRWPQVSSMYLSPCGHIGHSWYWILICQKGHQIGFGYFCKLFLFTFCRDVVGWSTWIWSNGKQRENIPSIVTTGIVKLNVKYFACALCLCIWPEWHDSQQSWYSIIIIIINELLSRHNPNAFPRSLLPKIPSQVQDPRREGIQLLAKCILNVKVVWVENHFLDVGFVWKVFEILYAAIQAYYECIRL